MNTSITGPGLLALAVAVASCGARTHDDAPDAASTTDAGVQILDASARDSCPSDGNAEVPSGPVALRCALHLDSAGMTSLAALAVDRDGRVVVTGAFSGGLDLGGATLYGAGGTDIYVARYGPRCELEWAFRLGGPGDDQGRSIAVDDAGGVVVSATFEGTIDLGLGEVTSMGWEDVLLVRTRNDGSLRWFRAYGTDLYDSPWRVAAGPDGTTGVTGAALPDLELSDPPWPPASGSPHAFVGAYSDDGELLFWRRFVTEGDPGLGQDSALGASIAIWGDMVLVDGWFSGTTDFGAGPVDPRGWSDVFVAAYSLAGEHSWSRTFGGPGQWGDSAGPLAVARDGTVLVAGGFWDTIDPHVNGEGFIGSLTPKGALRWSTPLDTAASVGASAIAVGEDGAAFLTGTATIRLEIGGVQRLVSDDPFGHPFAARLDADGAHVWSSWLGDGHALPRAMGVAPSGVIYVGGDFDGTVDLGAGEWTTAHEKDAFLLALEP